MPTANRENPNGRLSWLLLSFALACLWLTPAPVAARGNAVKVKQVPPQVEERYFNPEHPPDPPPPVPPGLRAVTSWNYHCQADITVAYLDDERRADEGVRASIQVKNYDIELTLPMIIWLPDGASEKLKEHEIGHTQIDKTIYDHARQIARGTASQLIGSRFQGSGPTLEAARQDAMHKAIMSFCDKYHEGTTAVARKLGAYYDQLTDHGRNDYPTKKAVSETLHFGRL